MSAEEDGGRALVVYESLFDNTHLVAAAIVRGLRRGGFEAHAVPVTSLAATVPVDVDLLVVGAPTHAFSLSRPTTREDAVRQGADRAAITVGLREWVRRSARPERFGTDRAVAFDTRAAKVRRLPASGAATASRMLRHRGFHMLRKPVGFLVEGTRGPLRDGEVARAERWGRMLAAACRDEGGAHRLGSPAWSPSASTPTRPTSSPT